MYIVNMYNFINSNIQSFCTCCGHTFHHWSLLTIFRLPWRAELTEGQGHAVYQLCCDRTKCADWVLVSVSLQGLPITAALISLNCFRIWKDRICSITEILWLSQSPLNKMLQDLSCSIANVKINEWQQLLHNSIESDMVFSWFQKKSNNAISFTN